VDHLNVYNFIIYKEHWMLGELSLYHERFSHLC